MISRIHKLHVKPKNVLGTVLIGNGHDNAVGKTHPWRLTFKSLKCLTQIRYGFDEYELTLWPKEFSSRLEGGLMTASFPQNIDRFDKDCCGKDDRPGYFTKPSC